MIEVEVEVKVADHVIQLLVEDISLAPYLNYLYKLYAFEKKKIHQPIYKYKKIFFPIQYRLPTYKYRYIYVTWIAAS